MLLRTLLSASMLLGPASPAPAAQPSPSQPPPGPPPSATDAAAQPAAAQPEPGEAEAEQSFADVVLDQVLPCGLRVITVRDASLPVAAVVLSVEVGTRDDPDKLPGLVHALAYHLQQGNRELGPGEGIAVAHDSGGLAAMAVGHAQVRFESLIPISQLDEALRVEALRLRAPNVNRTLWLKSLSHARTDEREKLMVPRELIAAAWQEPALGHDGRRVDKALGDMLDQAVEAQLARLFDYRAATLVVVGPEDPQALLARVEPLFADLPARPRKTLPVAQPGGSSKIPTSGPVVVELVKQKGDALLWAVPGDPGSRAWAQVLCGTLNRQRPAADEPPKARLRCTYADDPRRPLLLVRAIGFDPAQGPEPLIAARLDRIAKAEQEPELAALIEDQRARIVADLEFDLRTPLELASYLASASERSDASKPGADPLRPRVEILGLPLRPELAEPSPAGEPTAGGEPAPDLARSLEQAKAAAQALVAAVPRLLDTRAAVLPLDPELPVPPRVHPDPPSPSEAAPSEAAPAEGAGGDAG